MKKTGLMTLLLGLSFTLLGMEEASSPKRQETEYLESKIEIPKARIKLNAKSLKEICLNSMCSTIIDTIDVEKPLDSQLIREIKSIIPYELYNDLLIHLRNYTQPIWTQATRQMGSIESKTCINNGNIVTFLDSYFKTDPAKCHLCRLEQRRTFAQDFAFSNEVHTIALAPITNHCALANDDELILFNIENEAEKFIPIYSGINQKDGIIFNDEEQITTLTFCANGTSLFIGTNLGRCIILNDITPALDHDAPEYHKYFSSPLTAFGCTSDGKYLFATSDNGDMIATKKKDRYSQIKNVPITLPNDIGVKNILVSPDSSIIACNMGQNKCYFYNVILEKTVCYPETHFFAIDNDNCALAHIVGNGLNLLGYLKIDFIKEEFDLTKAFILPKNALLLPNNNHVNPGSICLIDKEEENDDTEETTCILKPKAFNLNELLINLAIVKCVTVLKNADALNTLETNHKMLIKTFKEILGSSISNLLNKYIKTYAKQIKQS